MPNIVQVEFFHPAALHKVCIRFFDQDSRITNTVMQMNELQRKRDSIIERVASAEYGRLYFWLLEWRHRKIISKYVSMKKRVREAVSEVFKDSGIYATRRVALQNKDFSFHAIREDEVKNTTRLLKEAVDFWIFIYKPNNLYADKTELVTYNM